jgi:hypothetical protein
MNSHYKIDIQYSSDEEKRLLEPSIDKELEIIKAKLEAIDSANILTITK